MSGEPTAVEPRPAIVFAPEHDVPVRYMERTREYYRDFSQCPACSRVYWQGSHYSSMQRFIEAALSSAARASRW